MTKGIRTSNTEEHKEPIVQQTGSPVSAGRVVVLSDVAAQGHELVAMLEKAGYQVEIFMQLSDFQSICGGQPAPVAVILDTTFKQGENTLARTLAEMQARCQDIVPVIFLSPQEDIAARLAAYRSGATRYLPKPVDSACLLRIIAESAPPTPAQPYRVMLVVDESEQHTEYAMMLHQSGMDVLLAYDPLLVLELLENFAADVLVLGMDMAQCSGPELAAILRDEQRYAAIPIVYLPKESQPLPPMGFETARTMNSNENYLSKLLAPTHLIAVISKQAQNYRRNMEQA